MILMLTTACRSTRKIAAIVTPVQDTLIQVVDTAAIDSARRVSEAFDRIAKNQISYTTFSAKVKVDYKDTKNKNIDFNAFIRMHKDSVIWASIIAALGIEAYRVMITPDSVVILDKLEKTVQYAKVSYLQEITRLPFDFRTLQDLIVGNPIYMQGVVSAFREEPGNLVSLSLLGDLFKHLLTFSRGDFTLQTSKLDDLDLTRSRTAKLTYEDYQQNGVWKFSNIRRVTFAEKNKVDLLLDFKQVEFDKPLAFPFSIPKNYTIK